MIALHIFCYILMTAECPLNDKSLIHPTMELKLLYIWIQASAAMWINFLTHRKYEKAWKGPRGWKRGGWRASAAAKGIKLWFTWLWLAFCPPHRDIVSTGSQDFKEKHLVFLTLLMQTIAWNLKAPCSVKEHFTRTFAHTYTCEVYSASMGHLGSTRNTKTQDKKSVAFSKISTQWPKVVNFCKRCVYMCMCAEDLVPRM